MRGQNRTAKVFGKQRCSGQNLNCRRNHGGESARAADDAQEPGGKSLAHDSQQRKITVTQLGQGQQCTKPDQNHQRHRDAVKRHENSIAPQDLPASSSERRREVLWPHEKTESSHQDA